MELKMKTGTYVGTGSAVTIQNCNFRPRYIKVVDETDGTVAFEYIGGSSPGESLAAGSAYETNTSGANQTNLSIISSNGFTVGTMGFTVGSSLSTSGKTYRWVAFGY